MCLSPSCSPLQWWRHGSGSSAPVSPATIRWRKKFFLNCIFSGWRPSSQCKMWSGKRWRNIWKTSTMKIQGKDVEMLNLLPGTLLTPTSLKWRPVEIRSSTVNSLQWSGWTWCQPDQTWELKAFFVRTKSFFVKTKNFFVRTENFFVRTERFSWELKTFSTILSLPDHFHHPFVDCHLSCTEPRNPRTLLPRGKYSRNSSQCFQRYFFIAKDQRITGCCYCLPHRHVQTAVLSGHHR